MEPRNNNLNILAVLAGALQRCTRKGHAGFVSAEAQRLRCRSLAGNDHAARQAPCIASRQRTHICPTYYFSAPKALSSRFGWRRPANGFDAILCVNWL